jgi:polar amino acid transport system permease protein
MAGVVGLIWGAFISRSSLAKAVSTPLIDLLRAMPPLVVVLFGYYFLSRDVVGVAVPAFITFTIALGLSLAAFVADLTRAAVTNVPQGYIEMGLSFGMTERQLLRHVVTPLAARELVAPLSYLGIETVKLTSLASVINVKETVYVAQLVIVDAYRSLEVWIVVAAIYAALIWPATVAVRAIESHLKRTAGLTP